MDLSSPRIRFNHGFHDGAADVARGKFQPGGMLTPTKPHFDKLYEQGYRAGYAKAQVGESTETSDPAWKTRCTCGQKLGFHSEKCRASRA